MTGARSHFANFHSIATVDITASTTMNILRRNGVTAAKFPALTVNNRKPEMTTAANATHIDGRSCSVNADTVCFLLSNPRIRTSRRVIVPTQKNTAE
jgi:hypothetical protein